MNKFHVVIGGGIAGICTALFLSNRYKSVILVERSSSLGGLLNTSFPFNNEFHFDYGTHFLSKTGDKSLALHVEETGYKDFLQIGKETH